MKTMTKLILLLTVITAASVTAFAEMPTEKKTEFRKLVILRNRLHNDLQALDKQSADQLKQGKDTTKLNGRQVTIQDRLDLNQLRLETMAARYELEIPDLPKVNDKGQLVASNRIYGVDAFQRGRTRTLQELKRQTFQLLRSLDYSILISKLKEN